MKAGPTVALLKCPRIHQPKFPTCTGKFRDFPPARSTSSPRRIILRASGHHFKLRETSLELSHSSPELYSKKITCGFYMIYPHAFGMFLPWFFITRNCVHSTHSTQLFRFQCRARSVFCALWHSVESPLRCFSPSLCSMWVGNPASNVEILNEYCTYYTTSTTLW